MRRAELGPAASDLEGFRLGFELCAAGREWDAHEVWEELWKARRGTPDGALLRGLIQWAAAGVKLKAERLSGALSLVDKALATWGELPGRMVFDGGLPGESAAFAGGRGAEGSGSAVGRGEAAGAASFDVDAARAVLREWCASEGAWPLPLPTLEGA